MPGAVLARARELCGDAALREENARLREALYFYAHGWERASIANYQVAKGELSKQLRHKSSCRPRKETHMSDLLARLNAPMMVPMNLVAEGSERLKMYAKEREEAAAEIHRLNTKIAEFLKLLEDGDRLVEIIRAEIRRTCTGFPLVGVVQERTDGMLAAITPHLRAREQAAAKRMQERCAVVCDAECATYLGWVTIKSTTVGTDKSVQMHLPLGNKIRALKPETV